MDVEKKKEPPREKAEKDLESADGSPPLPMIRRTARTHLKRNWSRSLVMTEEDLQLIHQLCEKFFKSVEITLQCADGTSVEFPTIEALLSFEHPSTRRATGLRFELGDYLNDRGHIFLHGGIICGSVELMIWHQRDDAVLTFQKSLDEILSDVGPRFRWWGILRPAVLFPSIALLFVFVISVLSLIFPDVSSDSDTKLNTAKLIPPMVAIVATVWVAERAWSRHLFPEFWLNIGRQKRAYESVVRNQKILGGIAIGLTVSALVGLLRWLS